MKAAAAGTVQTQPVEEGVDDLLLDLTAKKKKKKSTKTKADEDGAPVRSGRSGWTQKGGRRC